MHFAASKRVLFSGNSAVDTEQHSKRKKERAASKKAYDYLVKSYIIRLCCDSCIEDQPVTDDDAIANGCSSHVRVRLRHTKCLENKLVLLNKQSNLKDDFPWIRIRACPPDFKSTSGVCEKLLNGEPCPHRNRCRFPHSKVEEELWKQYFSHSRNGSSITVDGFIDDLRNSSLHVRFEVEQMWQKLKMLKTLSALEFKLICQECWKKESGEVSEKRPHAPECQKGGHRWNGKSNKLILAIGHERIIDMDSDENWTDEERTAVEAIRECQKRLTDLKITDSELISELNRLKKQEERSGTAEQDQRRHLLDEHWERLFNDDDSISGSYGYPDVTVDDESQVDVEEDLSQIYADDELDDAMTVCSSDLDSSDDEAYAEDPYYQLQSVTEARELLESQPDKYKRCTIHLDGPFSAKCRMLDEGFRVPRVQIEDTAASEGFRVPHIPMEDAEVSSEGDDVIREVEIRGRANCGPCFDGDEVVVKLKKTKELDGDKIIYRGTVIAVLVKKILRKAYTFVCRVDTYLSHLMKPLDGVAPKIHVVNSILKKKYKHRKDELVAVYSMVDKELKLQKIVKLDPRQRRDMLFVVK